MPETIAKLVIKKTGVASAVPPLELLELGELALNYNDGVLFYRDSNNVIQEIGVKNPASLAGNQIFENNITVNGLATFNGISMNVLTLPDGTIEWDCHSSNLAETLLTQNSVLENLVNPEPGSYVLRVKQDSTGGHTLTFGSDYRTPEGELPTLNTTAGSVSILTILKGTTSGLYLMAQTNFVPIIGGPAGLTDTDGDDMPDITDAFPADPDEWLDTDSDGVGDNADPDPLDPDVPGAPVPDYVITDTPRGFTIEMFAEPVGSYLWYGTDPIPSGTLYKGVNPYGNNPTHPDLFMAPRDNDINGQWVIGWADTPDTPDFLYEGMYNSSVGAPLGTFLDANDLNPVVVTAGGPG
jgi:hypothetical protein